MTRRRRPFPAAWALLLALVAAASPAQAPAQTPAQAQAGDAGADCERLAADPEDPARRHEGVPDGRVPLASALSRCGAAVAAAPDSPVHVFLLGRSLLLSGDTARGLERLKEAGALGYAAAWFLIARTLQRTGSVEGLATAYRRAAELGHPGAQLAIGTFHHAGLFGVAQDHGEAIYWLSLAGENGNADAAAILGSMYLEGRGVDRDPDRALRMIERAVAAGSTRGRALLGLAHLMAPAGDKALGEGLIEEEARRGRLSALVGYLALLDAQSEEALERARRLSCAFGGPGGALFEAYLGEPLVCDEG